MHYLLDTHVLIWHAENQNLSQNVLNIINNPENMILVSHASLWEMTIKVSIGKLKLNFSIAEFPKLLSQNQFSILPFDFKEAVLARAERDDARAAADFFQADNALVIIGERLPVARLDADFADGNRRGGGK